MASPLNKRLRWFRVRVASIILLSFGPFFYFLPAYAQLPKYIRVAIIQDAESLSIKVRGSYEITAQEADSRALFRGRNLKTTVAAYKGGILLGDRTFNTEKLSIQIGDKETIIINGRTYRGNIWLIKKENQRLLAVNQITLEDYVKGILYHEVSHYWPEEALKAQAIISRTYAAYQIQENRLRDYEVTNDIYSQVYGGYASERYRTSRAVEQTRGDILTYQGRVIPAYFHATCAGHTEDASLLWNINMASLKGVPCGFCQDSPHFNWHCVLSAAEVEGKMLKAGYNIGAIKNIAILGRDSSGRITDLEISSDKNNLKVSAKDFRNIIGPNIIRSTNFKANSVNRDIVFEGFGWGHGVGLCQWGAYFMAKQGRTAKQIFTYYYPGAEISSKP